jgi:Sigma-70, region 4
MVADALEHRGGAVPTGGSARRHRCRPSVPPLNATGPCSTTPTSPVRWRAIAESCAASASGCLGRPTKPMTPYGRRRSTRGVLERSSPAGRRSVRSCIGSPPTCASTSSTAGIDEHALVSAWTCWRVSWAARRVIRRSWRRPKPSLILVAAREALAQACFTVLTRLTATQRAVLILRDVLCWSARATATLLGTTVAAVNSALQRARATLRAARSTAGEPWPPKGAMGADERTLLARYIDGLGRPDAAATLELVRGEVWTRRSRRSTSPRRAGRDARRACVHERQPNEGEQGRTPQLSVG